MATTTQTDALQRSTIAVPTVQTVSVTDGQATNSVQAPTPTGNMWFAFEIGTGTASLNVNFNGQTLPNIPPGDYVVSGLTTPLNLDVTVDGSTKLAWAPQ